MQLRPLAAARFLLPYGGEDEGARQSSREPTILYHEPARRAGFWYNRAAFMHRRVEACRC